MLTPDYYLSMAEPAERIAELLHNEILKQIVRRVSIRLGRGDDYVLTAIDKWQLETLQQSGYLREDLIKEIAKYTKLQRAEIRNAFEDAEIRSLTYDDALYAQVGIGAADVRSPVYMRIMERNYNATMGLWDNFTKTTADAVQRMFIEQCDNAYHLVTSGAEGYTKAYTDAIDSIIKDGAIVTYPTGHTDTIETATLRCIRTGVAQTTAQITLARQKEEGYDLVLTSAHLGARPSHEVWQGKVFHIDWDTVDFYRQRQKDEPLPIPKTESKYPDFVTETRYGYVDGLCGANCRHSFSPYFEGISTNPFEQIDTEDNAKAYNLTQEQRSRERAIRELKRRKIALNEAKNNCSGEAAEIIQKKFDKVSEKLNKANKDYISFCQDNDLRPLPERLRIAR